MINKLRVRNYKALHDVDIDFGPINVLIGPNDSGKTSLLDVVGALGRSVDKPLSAAFAGPWDGRSLVWLSDPDLNVEIEADLGSEQQAIRYHLDCRFSPQGRSVTLGSEWFETEGQRVEAPGRGHASTVVYRVVQHNEDLAEPLKTLARRVHHALRGVHTYRFNPRALALPVAPDSSRTFRMDVSGFGLALCLDDILGYDRKLFGALEDRLRSVFGTLRSIKLLPGPAYRSPLDDQYDVPLLSRSDGKGIHFEFEGMPKPIPASQVSDGLLLVLAYLTLLHLPKQERPRLVLIEEPENGIHPKRLEDVIDVFRDVIREQSDTQMLMTTHSPYVVDLFKPEEVYLCRMGDDHAAQVRRLSGSQCVSKQLDVFTLGEIWTAEGDDRLAQDADMAEVPRV